jgi:hypothetical protein
LLRWYRRRRITVAPTIGGPGFATQIVRHCPWARQDAPTSSVIVFSSRVGGEASRPRLGELLIRLGYIDDAKLQLALERQREVNERLGWVMIQMGFVSERKLVAALAHQLQIQTSDLRAPIPRETLALIPEVIARKMGVIPCAVRGDVLFVAAVDPLFPGLIGKLEKLTRMNVEWLLASESDMDEALVRFYGGERKERWRAPPRQDPTPETKPDLGDRVAQELSRAAAGLQDLTAKVKAKMQPKLQSAVSGGNAPAAPTPPPQPRKFSTLAELLLREGKVPKPIIDRAIELQGRLGISLFATLVDMGLFSESDLLNVLSKGHGVPIVDLDQIGVDPQAVRAVPIEIAVRHSAIAINRAGKNLIVALADPANAAAIEDFKFISRCSIEVFLASESSIAKAIARYYSSHPGAEPVKPRPEPELVAPPQNRAPPAPEPPPPPPAAPPPPVIELKSEHILRELPPAIDDLPPIAASGRTEDVVPHLSTNDLRPSFGRTTDVGAIGRDTLPAPGEDADAG